MSDFRQADRAPWGDFPKVVRNGDLGSLAKEPSYLLAKQGDIDAALTLVSSLITNDTISQLTTLLGESKPRIVPVLALEETGANKIPVAMAAVLAVSLGLELETDIVQTEKVYRTGAGADHRLAFNPSFEGNVVAGDKYIVVDDTLAMGGTLASLRGYIENKGGKVVAASVMSAHEGALELAINPKMLAAIIHKHGPAMDEFCKESFGYGIDRLTQGEAGQLKAAKSVDAIRDRITAARDEGSRRVGTGRVSAQARASQPDAVVSTSAAAEAGESLLAAAQEIEAGQQALIETAPVEQAYQQTLALYAQAKHDQVERIEERLEQHVARQQVCLMQLPPNIAGLLSRPFAKAAWQQQQARHQARLETLHSRREAVRELKEGMGVYGSKIEELAARKMRAENPGLAADWDSLREAERRNQALTRNQEQEQKLAQERERGSHGQTLNLPKFT